MSSLSLADQLNHSIEALLAHSNPGLPATDRSMTELLEIAAELRLLPRATSASGTFPDARLPLV